MRKPFFFKTLALLMACMLCQPGAYAQEYDETWNIDGVEYAFSAAQAIVIGCYSQHLVAPPEVNLYFDDGDGDGYDRIVPVTTIGNSAFYGSDLVTVDLGRNVCDLFYHSFYNCTSMTDIVCRSTTPPTVNSAFSSGMYSRVTVHVPSSALTAYKNDTDWKKFTNIVAITSEWGVDINSTSFPDAKFRNYLLTLYPKGYRNVRSYSPGHSLCWRLDQGRSRIWHAPCRSWSADCRADTKT